MYEDNNDSELGQEYNWDECSLKIINEHRYYYYKMLSFRSKRPAPTAKRNSKLRASGPLRPRSEILSSKQAARSDREVKFLARSKRPAPTANLTSLGFEPVCYCKNRATPLPTRPSHLACVLRNNVYLTKYMITSCLLTAKQLRKESGSEENCLFYKIVFQLSVQQF